MAGSPLSVCVVLALVQCFLTGGVVGVITDITPKGVFLLGGLEVTVTGTDLNQGTTTPKVVVTATYMTTIYTFTGDACTTVAATSLVCPSPVIDTDNITGYIQPSADTQRLLNDNGTLDFTIGVVWSTGMEDFDSIKVYKDPQITMKDASRTFTIWTNTIIRFFGYDLNAYIDDKSDYQVTIGNLDCAIDYVNSTWMSCIIPTTIPERDSVTDKSPVNMTIGNYQAQLGQLHYRVPFFDDKTDEFILYDPTDLANKVTVSGHYLMVGLNHSSYKVQIGIGECLDIVVSTTSLSCRPPGTAPAPLAEFPLFGELPQMVVTVPKDSTEAVFQYVYHTTYIKYGDTTDENEPGLPSDGQLTPSTVEPSTQKQPGNDDTDSWKWIVVGVCSFVGAAFLVVLFSCLCCSNMCAIGRQRLRWVEKEPFYKIERETDSTARTQTPRSSIRSYQTRTSSGTYPTPSQLYYITQQRGY